MSVAVETQRNPTLSLAEIEAVAKKAFHVQHIVWVERGVGDDDQSWNTVPGPGGKKLYTAIGTGGHVDECVHAPASYSPCSHRTCHSERALLLSRSSSPPLPLSA